jgi:hypothetical protein
LFPRQLIDAFDSRQRAVAIEHHARHTAEGAWLRDAVG